MPQAPDRRGRIDRLGPLARALQDALVSLPGDRASARVLLAVSGGPDSLALLLAGAELRDAGLVELVAIATVDHALRPESAAEAAFVEGLSRDLGLSHSPLTWRRDGTPAGNLSAEARDARYALLAREARRIGAGAILTAHHLDDQLETHLLAKARGAHGAALAAMRAWRDLEPGVVLLRPFLSLRKADLADVVRRAGLVAVDDPSNRDPRFARARLRAEGLRESDAALRGALAQASAERAEEDAALAGDLAHLLEAGQLAVSSLGEIEIARVGASRPALLSRAVTAAGGGAYPPARDALARLALRIEAEPAGAATLGGAAIAWAGSSVRLSREYGRAGPPDLVWPQAASRACFDARFDIEAGGMPFTRIVPQGRWGRGPLRHRTLPVALSEAGAVLAAHPALGWKAGETPAPLAVSCRVGWRLAADLVLPAGSALTGQLQIAANRGEPVGKGVADTYIRGQVEAACVARREVARAHFQDG